MAKGETMPTSVLFTSAIRQGSIAADFSMPETTESELVLHLDLSPQDMEDSNTVVNARVLVSRDSGATWSLIAGGGWVGFPNTEKGGHTREWRLIVTDPGGHAGLPARCEIDLPSAARIAVRVSI